MVDIGFTEVLVGAIYIGATASLVAVCIYIALARKGDNVLLLSTSSSEAPSMGGWVFLILAVTGTVVCMYQGAEAMLPWVPDESWRDDELSARQSLAGFFAFLGGGCFIEFLDQATRDKTYTRIDRDRRRWVHTIEETQSLEQLREFKNTFQREIDQLNAKYKVSWGIRKKRNDEIWISAIEYEKETYRELIARINSLFPSDLPKHMPEEIGTVFMEGTRNLETGCWNAASCMFRISINLALKDFVSRQEEIGGFQKDDLYESYKGLESRLEWLCENNYLPDCVSSRVPFSLEDTSDEGCSEWIESDEEDARGILDFTSEFLKHVYQNPSEMITGSPSP